MPREWTGCRHHACKLQPPVVAWGSVDGLVFDPVSGSPYTSLGTMGSVGSLGAGGGKQMTIRPMCAETYVLCRVCPGEGRGEGRQSYGGTPPIFPALPATVLASMVLWGPWRHRPASSFLQQVLQTAWNTEQGWGRGGAGCAEH